MRIPRIFQDSALSVNSTLVLDERATKHLIQVLRCEVGREIILFNGQGGEYQARLSEATKRSASAEVYAFCDIERESSINIHLAQCVSKGDRFEFALQKAVELGVKEITPVISMRSQIKLNHERKDKKLRHWKQISLSACEQSGRTQIVKINEPILLADFLEAQKDSDHDRIILDPEAEQNISSQQKKGKYILLIGPEGGFEASEIELAEKKNFSCTKLGKQILRTETAPIAAISALNVIEGEF